VSLGRRAIQARPRDASIALPMSALVYRADDVHQNRKAHFVRIVLVRYLRSEGRLSQISIGDRGSALGWEQTFVLGGGVANEL
jgi:hypothetical protein